MMKLVAYDIPSDTVKIPYEWTSGLICGDDDKLLIISPYVLPLMLKKA